GWLSLYTATQAFFPDWAFLGTLVGWTLTLELIFYLIAPLFLKWFYGKSAWQVLAICLVASGLLLGSGVLLSQLPPVPNTLLGADRNWIMHHSFFGHAPDFLVGMFCAYLYLTHDSQDSRWRRQASKLIWGSVGVIYGATLLLVRLGSPTGAPQNRSLGFVIALASSVLILAIALDETTRNPVARFLSWRWVVYLGSISYALYLIQLTEPIQWLYWLALGKYGGVENRIWQAVLIFLITIPIAALWYELFEKPVHRFLARLSFSAGKFSIKRV
ncbi:MAG: acyltransferase, partial [Anaerolineales bacterium]|nr:acyltransferase [Anaerolineales bacterium]